MTVLLELKQKIKAFYSEHDMLVLSLLKFLLGFLLFQGINTSLGFMKPLNNIFVVLILAIICAVLPINAMTVIGCIMVIVHCYAIGIEVAGFAGLLILLLLMLFLRFTSQDNLALVLTPVAFTFKIPVAVPIGSGLLRGPSCAVPACCGVVLYSFMQVVQEKSAVLQGKETEIIQKLQLLLDGLMKNQEMWITIVAFIIVLMTVYLISRCSFDYSWKVANIAGAVVYIVITVLGGMFLSVDVNIPGVILAAVLSVLIGFIIEFAVLGVDYSRSEHTQFEDDEYVYYVKAVPKSIVAQKKKSIKKISTEFEKKEDKNQKEATPVERVSEENFNFEKQLEESLKDL